MRVKPDDRRRARIESACRVLVEACANYESADGNSKGTPDDAARVADARAVLRHRAAVAGALFNPEPVILRPRNDVTDGSCSLCGGRYECVGNLTYVLNGLSSPICETYAEDIAPNLVGDFRWMSGNKRKAATEESNRI